MKVQSHRIDGARLDAAMARAKFTSDMALADEIGIWSNQIARWRKGKSTPAGDNLAKLLDALGVTADWLFGKEPQPSTEVDRLIEQVRRVLGKGAAEAVEHMAKLTPHHRAVLAGRIVGWVEGLAQYEQTIQHEQMPVTQFDRDRAELERREHLSGPRPDRQPSDRDRLPAGGESSASP